MNNTVCFLLLLAGLAIIALLLWPDKPVPVQPTGNPSVIVERLPLLGGSTTVVIADTTGKSEKQKIEDAGKVAVTVTVEADTMGDSVHLLVDRPAPAWFPEADLLTSNIRIRTLHPRQVPLVMVVQQRMPVFDVELVPIAGIVVGKEPKVFGGVMLFRAWIFHIGVGASYSIDRGIRVDVPVAVEVRPNLMAGATVRENRAFLVYRF